MTTPQIIVDLVNRFERNIEEYKRAHNETQIRREFIDPLFTALGWDVDNKGGAAPQYQDVIHEAQQIVGGSIKAPDYAFRVGGTKKFYVEAKKPSVWVKEAPAPAYQVRSYGWSAKLPVSIVTDFEEFAVYDCTQKPKNGDKPSVARINYFTYKDYLTRWDEIESVFSKEAVIKGQFDKYSETSKGKRGTTTVDKAFLLEIESWRELLAKNFAKNNKISEEELKFATQRTLDRIIFLRICEARGIEEEGRLQEAVVKPNSFKELFTLFQAADNRYNSGLFYFRKGDKVHKTDAELDTITPKLKLDDKILKEVIAGLYYPSPYKFDVIPADILGQVYEQFLGKVIRMTSGGMVKIEEKPEVRKAGGVYYTPTYIVDYIVKNTVGELLKDSKKKDIKILDPACGSGSFLLGAYDYLLKWYLEQYTKDAKTQLAKKNSPIYEVSSKNYALTTSEKKRILLEHIYGVDIDENAVEVAKLNLMLKCLEGEGAATLKLSVERILPDLSDNIKCGNSLIGSDFNDGLFSNDEHKKINPFEWNTEFADIMKKGGFDVVIGNPPYGAFFEDVSKKYLSSKYVNVSDYESYQYFLVKSFELLKTNGLSSYIVPNTLLLNMFAKNFRQYLATAYKIRTVLDLSNVDVFTGVNVRTIVPVFEKANTNQGTTVVLEFIGNSIQEKSLYKQEELRENDEVWISILSNQKQKKVLDRIKSVSINLNDILEVSQGLIPYDKYRGHDEYTIKNRIWNSDHKKDKTYKKELRGGDVSRYNIKWNGVQWISYGAWLAAPRKVEYFTMPRILFREITDPKTRLLHVTFTDQEYYNNPGLINCIKRDNNYDLKFILGVTASRLISFYHYCTSPKANKGLFPKILVNDVRNLPIRKIQFAKIEEKFKHDKIVSLVDQMLILNKELPLAKTPNDKTRIERQITATDNEIDKLVYELYGLTEEEIKIIESSDVTN